MNDRPAGGETVGRTTGRSTDDETISDGGSKGARGDGD